MLQIPNIAQFNLTLLDKLNEREKIILTRRFGLQQNSHETLDKIGKGYSLTRERVRQIESAAVRKLENAITEHTDYEAIKKAKTSLILAHGGIIETNYFIDLISLLSDQDFINLEQDQKNIYRNNVRFLISKLFKEAIEEQLENAHLLHHIRLKNTQINNFNDIAKELSDKIEEQKQVLKFAQIIALWNNLESAQRHANNINESEDSIDLSEVFAKINAHDQEINDHKIIYSILRAASRIEQGRLGDWGIKTWPDITPKTTGEKIDIIFSHAKEPIHFKELTKKINEIGFDKRRANEATVHNELILNKKYVLVGRGLYAPKKWGIPDGTLIDVIVSIIEKNEGKIKKDLLVEETLKHRSVKHNTINLSLNNKQIFKKEGGYILLN